jgi:hypothetical protein
MSLPLIAVPLTRAITGSFGLAASGWDADEDDEFLEQPATAGRASSASAATVANLNPRGRGAANVAATGEQSFSNGIGASLE